MMKCVICGKESQYKYCDECIRRKVEIKVWLEKNGIQQKRIAEEVGVTPAMVSYTISGRWISEKVVKWLIEHGCPEEYLKKPLKEGCRV